MRKLIGFIALVILPFILVICIVRVYLHLPNMDAEDVMNVFAKMPDFGAVTMGEFLKLEGVGKDFEALALEFGAEFAQGFSRFSTISDPVTALIQIGTLLVSLGNAIINTIVLVFKSLWYLFTFLGMVIVTPISMVVYFVTEFFGGLPVAA